jgi:hypothetical protein
MNMRSIFKQLIGAGSGRQDPSSAIVPGDRIPGDLAGLARMSQSAIRDGILFEPTIPLNGFCTDDIDKETGRLYPDFLERRKARREAEANPEPRLCGVYENCHPDD